MRDAESGKKAGFGRRGGAEKLATAKPAATPSMSERLGRFFQGLLSGGKTAPKSSAKRKKPGS